MFNRLRNRFFIGVTSIFLLSTLFVQAQSPKLELDTAREHFERARAYDASGDPRAEQEYRQAIADRGGIYSEAWEELSAYLARRQRFDEAASAWQKYLKQTRPKAHSPNLERLRRLDRGAALKARSEKNGTLRRASTTSAPGTTPARREGSQPWTGLDLIY